VKRALLVATVSLVGCGGGEARQAAPSPPPPPSLAKRCGDGRVPARTLWFSASDGTRLDGAELGEGSRGVVLLHESPGDLCGWSPYAKTLARRGFHVLLVDLRAFGLSHRGPYGGPRGGRADVRGAVDELKRLGATRVVVVGASYGGVVALVSAPTLGSQIAAVASLSGETALGSGSWALNALAAVRRIRVPLLIMGSREDRYFTEAEAGELVRAARSTQVSVAEFDGTFHGWDLLSSSPQRQRADDILVAFLGRETE
jgi:pimeloyl-ACP methyl ester carboxylesterase